MEHNDLCVGIDLGTTNSVIATCIVDNGRIDTPVSRVERYIEMSSSNYRKESGDILPSYVYYADNRGTYEPIVGDFAKKVYMTQPFSVAKSIKNQMGQPTVSIPGWKPDFPDQTPEAISSRIIKHMVQSLEEYYGEDIKDVVITVPASFNLAQREATLKAAQLAGLDVLDDKGEYRDDILLSEPEAMVYDILNQAQCGKINLNIDFTTPKKVLVFDIGGGTLDITLHEISRDENKQFEIRPLATNRYSTIAGDHFDKVIASWMYKQYINEYKSQSAEIVRRIEKDPQSMVSLIEYAEQLKIKVSNRYKDRLRRGNALKKSYSFDYGGYMPNGYNSENSITLEEFEEILEPLMGRNYKYDDYKQLTNIEDENNIIYPILNVLYKASMKLGTDNFKVDAVILNGGESRLYMIEDRLKEFFGFKPITVSDPDKSVAMGASIYHYYLHQNDNALNMHQKFQKEQEILDNKIENSKNTSQKANTLVENKINPGIHSTGTVLNETIYLGLKAGAVIPLVESGTELPYLSDIKTGFCINKGQNRLRIPIKQLNQKNIYKTIAIGDITFPNMDKKKEDVAIQFLLNKNGTLRFQAWAYDAKKGFDKNITGFTILKFGEDEEPKNTTKKTKDKSAGLIKPPSGTVLVVSNELSTVNNLIKQFERENGSKKSNAVKLLQDRKKQIMSCGNPKDFASGMLDIMNNTTSLNVKLNFLTMARKLAVHWSDRDRKQLSHICMSYLSKTINNFSISGIEISVANEAIRTLNICGSDEQISKLKSIKNTKKIRSSLLYIYGHRGIESNWVYNELVYDYNNYNALDDSLRSMGLVILNGRNKCKIDVDRMDDLVEVICGLINSKETPLNTIVLGITTLGHVCDARNNNIQLVSDEALEFAKFSLNRIEAEQSEKIKKYTVRARNIANTMISGSKLTDDDEKYLLSLYSAD